MKTFLSILGAAILAVAVIVFVGGDRGGDGSATTTPTEATSTDNAAVDLAQYENSRFRFSVVYPADWSRETAQNNDGAEFTAPSGAGTLTVFGSFNATDQSLEELFGAEGGRYATITDADTSDDSATIYGTNSAGVTQVSRIIMSSAESGPVRIATVRLTHDGLPENTAREIVESLSFTDAVDDGTDSTEGAEG